MNEYGAADLDENVPVKCAVDFSEAELLRLDEYAMRYGVTEAEAIVLAVQLMLGNDARERRKERSAALAATFGMWKDRGIDTDTYLADLRAEWDRPAGGPW